MSRISHQKSYGNYGFRFQDMPQNNIANISSIGLEFQTSADYYWDGLLRRDIQGVEKYVFQYTLSGKGAITFQGKQYSLHPGEAFFVQLPSPHCYFLPENSEGWEFIYITLTGGAASTCWNFIHDHAGKIVKIPFEADLIQLLRRILQETNEQKIIDAYISSAKAYEFIMECFRFMKNLNPTNQELPEPITRVITFLQQQYDEYISIDRMAAIAELSSYYFIKQFRKHTNTTPAQYLTKIRMKKATELLRHTDLSIKDIAAKIGYENANYFNKVFRKITGFSPLEFRESKISNLDYLVF
ncbi:transcriptional regulator [Neobacillus bataviensis LMG 21833]|uniref:Transcriptional regulator n=1 Tax=Neobacillus bataviensis LMG 21833 TaxID=1117379 RepID=K6CYB6_9BACI|nr:AraC family transcriptional regulator [Neobacillus bataviensis]EKN65222.1 transcriptional regulator [Neobacillus bataviensis LMG 21833]